MKDLLNDRASTTLRRLGYSDQRARDAKREAWWWLGARAGVLHGRRLFGGRAVVWTHPGRCELLPVEVVGPGPRDVTIEVEASIVSIGTERANYSGAGNLQLSFPVRPGYSAAGVVVAAGRQSGLAVGDHVAAAVGHSSVVTAPAGSVYPVPQGVTSVEAAFVQLGVISRHGVNVAELEPGASVCVIGSGIIGALALRLCAAAGAGETSVVAWTRRRERLARAGGARTFVALSEGEAAHETRADVVIDATGDPAAFVHAVAAAADGGRVVLLGSPRGITRNVPIATIRAKRLTVVGAHVSTLLRGSGASAGAVRAEACAFLDQLAAGSVSVTDLIDLELDPRDAPAFYRGLPGDSSVTAACFDWTRLADAERLSVRSPLRPPDMSARGIAFRSRPLAIRDRHAEELAVDPLVGATGMLRVALLGCGDIGEQNAAAIASAPNARLVACFDPLPALADELARRFGAEAVGSLDDVLARDDLDAVFLAVPHDLHAPLALQAAASGLHVIVEKPLAQSLDAAARLAVEIRRAGVRLTVCFPHRYDPAVLAARSLLANGAIGELEGTLTSFLSDKPPSYWRGGFSGRAASDWRSSRGRAGGGVLIMNLSHYVDLGLHLAGNTVDEVSAYLSSTNREAEVEDSVSVSIRYANGAVGSLFGGSSVPGTWEGRGSSELRLWGTEGHVSIDDSSEFFSLKANRGLRAGRWHKLSGLRAVPLRTAFVSRFATAVELGTPADVEIDAALAVQAFIEAAYLSAREGRPVRPSSLLADALARHSAPEEVAPS